MHFIDQSQLPIDQAEFVLGIHQDQPGLPRDLLAARKNRQRCRFDLRVEVRRDKATRENIVPCQAFVVRAARRFGGRRDDRGRQRIVFTQTVRQRDPVRLAIPGSVERPQRGGW